MKIKTLLLIAALATGLTGMALKAWATSCNNMAASASDRTKQCYNCNIGQPVEKNPLPAGCVYRITANPCFPWCDCSASFNCTVSNGATVLFTYDRYSGVCVSGMGCVFPIHTGLFLAEWKMATSTTCVF